MPTKKQTEIISIIAVSILALIFVLYILYCIYVVICSMRDESIFFGLINFNDRKGVKHPVNIIYDNNDIISRTKLSSVRVNTRTKGAVAEVDYRYFFSYKYTLTYGENYSENVSNNTSYLFLPNGTVLDEQTYFTFEENKVVGTVLNCMIPIALYDYFDGDNTYFKITVERTVGRSTIPPGSISRVLLNNETIFSSNTTVILQDIPVTSNTFSFEDIVMSI